MTWPFIGPSWVQFRKDLPAEFVDRHEQRTGKVIDFLAGDDGRAASLTFTDRTFETILIHKETKHGSNS